MVKRQLLRARNSCLSSRRSAHLPTHARDLSYIQICKEVVGARERVQLVCECRKLNPPT